MENSRRASRRIRVLLLTLAVWPFVSTGRGADKSGHILPPVPGIAACRASALVGDGGDGLLGAKVGYDSVGRCVVGDGGCGNEF